MAFADLLARERLWVRGILYRSQDPDQKRLLALAGVRPGTGSGGRVSRTVAVRRLAVALELQAFASAEASMSRSDRRRGRNVVVTEAV